LQAFVKSDADLSWNYPSWSISSEMVAYVIFAVAIVPVNLYAKKFRVTALLLISLIGLIIFTHKFYPYVSRCIYGFFLGCVTYYLFNFFQACILKLKVLYNSIIEFIAIAVVVIFTSYVKWEPFVGYLLPVIYAVVIIIFACERGWLSKNMISSTLLNNTGTYSYSIYMVHALLAVITHIIVAKILKVHSAVVKDLIVVPFLVVVYYTSSFTYKHVEIGGKSVMKKLLRL
jgi:peptidoglycan/LPS O-acetylase OafA/YrhL